MIMAGTGHRPNKLGGYGLHITNRLIAVASEALQTYKPDKVISGMALGWDQALASAAVLNKIPFIAAVPFIGQERMWPPSSQVIFKELCGKAEQVVIVSPGEYSAAKMQTRNEWMVHHCDTVLALWDGTSGGTANCVRFAEAIKKPVINVWERWKS